MVLSPWLLAAWELVLSKVYSLSTKLENADGKVKQWSYDDRNVITTVTYEGDTVLSKSADAGNRCTSETFVPR